jgi:putative aldouronate transport system substrate-binding protein
MDPSETAEFLSIRSAIVEAVDNWARRFGTGEMDIDDDADWADYLSELQSLGVDRYVELVQSNYASQTW